ncbi:MAG: OsmC family protein, partial [SAR324 cluster bacterium]|nr:OsmC family protein [SAR324 cluster bacterium]
EGISLTKLEVAVDSEYDNRGLTGADDSVPPGPLTNRVVVRISAPGTAPERLREIVDWAESHSPVGDAVCRAIPGTFDLEIL